MGDNAHESLPTTDPYTPTFDTGAFSAPLESLGVSERHELPNLSATAVPAGNTITREAPPLEQTQAQRVRSDAGPAAGLMPPVQPVTVRGQYCYLKWWKLVLVTAGVWLVAAPIGLGLFYWWYHALNKTPAAFAVLVYVVVCTVGSLMLAMVRGKPLIAALAIAVMSAVFASVAAAAPLYGHYYCAHTQQCVAGIIPY